MHCRDATERIVRARSCCHLDLEGYVGKMAAEALRCEAGPSRTICADPGHSVFWVISPVSSDRGRLVQSENGKQGSVDAPLFFWCQMAGQVTKPVYIDRTNLLNKNTS